MLKGTKICWLITAQILVYLIGIYIIGAPVKEKLKTLIIGGTSGHISTICGDVSEKVDKFTSIDFAKITPSINDYYFYDIQNPQEYLKGGNAEVVEKGPYMLKQYQVNFDVGFKPSTLTASLNPNPNGTIVYKVANAYVALDADADLSSSLVKDKNATLSLSETAKKSLGVQEKMMPSFLSMSDSITSMSPAYLSLLKGANSELTLILSLMCSSAQIKNIANAGPGGAQQCGPTQMLDPEEGACACCMLSDTYDLVALADPNLMYTKCNDLLQETNPVMSTLSLLASYDGGVVIKSAGDPAFDGSGASFAQTLYGQTEFYTPLIQTHSVNDLMFGYPSALVGTLLAWWTVVPAWQGMVASGSTLTKTAVAKMVLTGQLDGVLPVKVGNMAKYTSDAGSVCSSTCSAVALDNPLFHSPLGWTCTGNAPKRTETSDVDGIILGGIDCKPYSGTFSTKMYCEDVESYLSLHPGAPGFEECQCAGNEDWADSGCCLAGGMIQGADLTGLGCLAPIPGAVDTNLLGQDKESSSKLDLGKAVESYIKRQDLKTQSVFMCPAPGVNQAEFQKFDYYETFGGQSQWVSFLDTGLPRVQIGDDLNKSAIPYTSRVSGGSGHYMPPAGLLAHSGGLGLAIGYPSQQTREVYIGPAKRSFSFAWQNANGLYPKSCGSKNCINTLRHVQTDSNFMRKDGSLIETGQGLPFNGLVSLGYLSGVPVYLHQPFFLGGDEELYTQLNNSFVQAVPGNGINMYHSNRAYYTYTNTPPRQFVVGSNNSEYQLVNKAWVEKRRTSFETYLDTESATGITLESRVRYGVSYSIWECNPELYPSCLLALKSKGQEHCYSDFGKQFFSSLPSDAKTYLESQARDNFTFPCSAANVFTPNVVGGKILPVYWFSMSTTARPDDVDGLISIGYIWRKWHRGYSFLMFVGVWLTQSFILTWVTPANTFAKTKPVS